MKVLDESGYTGFWQAQKTPEAEGRLENLKELVNAMDGFENLEGFLEHISLVMDGDNTTNEGEVTLMTLHAAKGLEFDTVFLPGWEEGLFLPSGHLDEKGGSGLEEERRLAYVGITRAERRLYISIHHHDVFHGLWQSAIPSRFIAELPKDTLIEDVEQGDDQGNDVTCFNRFQPADTHRIRAAMAGLGAAETASSCRAEPARAPAEHSPG